MDDDHPFIYNFIIAFFFIESANIHIFKIYMTILVTKLNFDINLKNFLEDFIHVLQVRNLNVDQLGPVHFEYVHDYVRILLDLGLKAGVNNKIKEFDHDFNTHIEDLILEYDIDIKDPGYD